MNEGATGNEVRVAGFSHIGRRAHNEDCYLLGKEIGLMVVADGVGGHEAGGLASSLTCEVLEREHIAGSSLERAVQVANAEVFQAVAQGRGREGMASTVVAVSFNTYSWELAWVGDSRAYLWDGQLGLLSRDHSLVENLVQSGQISIDDARRHPNKNIIEQAVGLHGSDSLRVGRNSGELLAGEVLLLCSDGLNDVLDNRAIVSILSSDASLQARCEQLVFAAVGSGGRDNTTVVLIEAGPDASTSAKLNPPDFVWRYDPVSQRYTPTGQRASDASAPEFPGGNVLMAALAGLSGSVHQAQSRGCLPGISLVRGQYFGGALVVLTLVLLTGLFF